MRRAGPWGPPNLERESVDEVFARREVIETATLRRLCVPSDVKGRVQTVSQLGALMVCGLPITHD